MRYTYGKCKKCREPMALALYPTMFVYCVTCGYRYYFPQFEETYERDESIRVCFCGKEFNPISEGQRNCSDECDKRENINSHRKPQLNKYKKKIDVLLKRNLTANQYQLLKEREGQVLTLLEKRK